MFKKVVAFGCSYSCWRQDFYTGFVDIIADKFQIPFKNYSLPGNSNEEIIYNFNQRYNNKDLEHTLILFQTTHLTRVAYWDVEQKDLLSLQLRSVVPYLNKDDDDTIVSNFNVKFNDSTNIGKIDRYNLYKDYYKYAYNDYYEFIKLFNNLIHLQSSIKLLNSKIVFLYFDSYYNTLSEYNKLNLFKPDGMFSSLEWAVKNKMTYSENDLHLSEYGNSIYANKLFDYINMDQNME